MAVDPRKRQKKLERKKAKDKARHKALAVRQATSATHRFERAAQGRVIDAFVAGHLRDEGLGQVMLARDLGADRVGFACFLIDVYCLGVKDVFFDVVSKGEYVNSLRGKLARKYEIEQETPEFIRKLVEDSVSFARSLGLEPHADYERARVIFGDIDASACSEVFEFGRDGKPCFISGPNDTPARCTRIIRTLTENCGEDNFDVVLQMTGSSLLSSGLSRVELPEG
ncbi:MAG TPA: hypothetical protein VHC19_05975 [Pirellulales bacterium]|nr:hypothetical protein [Pirellulales bacterium]